MGQFTLETAIRGEIKDFFGEKITHQGPKGLYGFIVPEDQAELPENYRNDVFFRANSVWLCGKQLFHPHSSEWEKKQLTELILPERKCLFWPNPQRMDRALRVELLEWPNPRTESPGEPKQKPVDSKAEPDSSA